VDDGTVSALEYERECRRYSEEMFTSFHRGDTYDICGVVEADMELFWDSWSVRILGERL